MKNILLLVWLMGLTFGVSHQVIANDPIRQVGLKDSPTIEIAPGQGLTITFLPSRRVIEKIWLDNPSWLTLDVDGCLQGLGVEKCELAGATSVHLRRIQPIQFPGLPQKDTSMLTVISRGMDGQYQISAFTIVAATGIQPLIVEVVPSTVSMAAHVDVTKVRQGRDIAISKGLIHEGDRLDQKIQRFLTLSQTQSVNSAIEQAGISLALVGRLVELGSTKY